MREKLNRRDFLKLAGALPLGLIPAISKPGIQTAITATAATAASPNILIVVLDALSAYHISSQGYPRRTTPNLDRLADRAIVYHNHYSGGNYTTPGTASLLTGTLPWNHRAIVFNDTVAESYVTRNIFSLFPGHHRLAYSHNPLVNTQLKQFLADIDNYTPRQKLFLDSDRLVDLLFTGDEDIASLSWIRALKKLEGTSYALFLPWIKETLKDLRVRDLELDYPRGLPYINVDDYYILNPGIDHLVQQVATAPKPFLGYYHFLPPHHPYNPSSDFVGAFNRDGFHIVDKGQHTFSRKKTLTELDEQNTYYDEFILYADEAFARLYNDLEDQGILANTWLILTSDHGELFERGILGHLTPLMHQPVIKIPLYLFEPGRRSRLDIDENTSSIDVLSTLLSLQGREIPSWVEGQVLPPFAKGNAKTPRQIFALQAKGIGKEDPIVKGTVMLVVVTPLVFNTRKHFGERRCCRQVRFARQNAEFRIARGPKVQGDEGNSKGEQQRGAPLPRCGE